MKEQTVWEWKDMIKQMRGETDVYWDDIKDIMESENSFIEYMKESSSYLNASDTDREYMIEEWRKLYQDMVAAQKIDADYDHSDTDFQTSSSVSSGTGSGGGGGGSYNDEDYQNIKRKISYTYGGKPIEHTVVGTLADAKRMVGIFAAQDAASLTDHITDEDRLRTIANQMMAKAVISKYANGGLIDFTGPAWVDGSPSRPEAILDAEDTSILRQILDACGKIKIPSFMSSISDALFGHNNSIGDVSITINEATINNDDDIETLAEKVGDAFVKQLSKQGFNTADYAI